MISTFAVVALLLAGATSNAHPSAICSVSSHGTAAAPASSSVDYTNVKGAGVGRNQTVIFDASPGGLMGAFPSLDVSYASEAGYWEYHIAYDSAPFVIAADAISGSAQVVAAQNKFLVTWATTDPAVKARSYDMVTHAVSTVVTVTNSEPDYSTLAAGSSFFFFAAVEGTSLSVFESASGVTWTSIDVTTLSAAASGELASAVDTEGNYLLVYHTSATELACASTVGGAGSMTAKSVPTVVGVQIALSQGGDQKFLVVANDASNITSAYTSDLADNWGASQVVESNNGSTSTPVAVAKIGQKWLVAYNNKDGASVEVRFTTASNPLSADWAQNTASTQFKGNSLIKYRNPTLQSCGGDGFIMGVTDVLNADPYTRSCFTFDVAATDSPTGSPTSSASGTHLSGIVFGVFASVLFSLFAF